MIDIKRTDIRLKADPRKVILKYLNFGNPARFEPVINYVMGLEEQEAATQLAAILAEFEDRHFDLKGEFLENYEQLAHFVPEDPSLTKKLLTGAYFTHEYSIQAAALFNPSIVAHPDQSNLGVGELRFIMSLRATGEGHISSITFQTGVISADGFIQLDPTSDKLTCGQHVPHLQFEKAFVIRRLESIGGVSELVRNNLPERFSRLDALLIIRRLEKQNDIKLSTDKKRIGKVFYEAYDLIYDDQSPLSSRVLYPQSGSESKGMEDARFVQFTDGEKKVFLATYTAYNGKAIRPQIIETTDFLHFGIRPLYGKAVSDKGMAFFPEKVRGKYAIIGRQGGRNLSIMYSDDLYCWEEYQPLQYPQRDWEMLQIGNCGSPVKTPAGWLMLTHMVGPMRKYVLSFSLLDLVEPEKVLASLEKPLLSPNAEEREGYVPNVLYTCGLIQHGKNLVIPYAMSDSAISFATVETDAVVQELLKNKK